MRKYTPIIVLSVCALAVLLGTCSSIEAGEPGISEGFPDQTTRARLFNVPAASFNHDGWYDANAYFFSFGTGAIHGTGNTSGCVLAPVTLPGYDTYIDRLYMSVYDNDPADFVWVDFWRVDNYTGVAEKIQRLQTSADGDYLQSIGLYFTDATYLDIDPLTYSYYNTSCIGQTTQRITSVRWWYESHTIFEDDLESTNLSAWSSAVQ